MTKIGIVGSGTVGSSWALVFARAGFEVALYDPSQAAVEAAMESVHRMAAELAYGESPATLAKEQLCSRIHPVPTLAECLRDAQYVQESAPERLPLKQSLYVQLGALAEPDAVLASSTSGMPASSFCAEMAGRERCLVAHPINPPHLIPLVEIVPTPWTAPTAIERAETLLKQAGQVPIRLRREIAGFVANRLQSAVLAEAFRLVEDNVCSVHDVDAAMTEGLGLRWFFMGPFQTIDLNAPGGVAEYCHNLAGMYDDLARQQAEPRAWSSELIATLARERRQLLPLDQLPERRAWRNRCLAKLLKAKSEITRER